MLVMILHVNLLTSLCLLFVVACLDELDIPNGENSAENEEEQEQPEVEEQEYYVEGLLDVCC